MHQLLNESFPVILIQFGEIFKICLKNCDFAVDGSPTINIFISLLKCVSFSKFFSTSPNECPYIPVEIELAKNYFF